MNLIFKPMDYDSLKLILLIFVVNSLFSCSSKTAGKVSTNQKEQHEEEIATVTDSIETEEQKKVELPTPQLIVSFERTPCFGNCPVFEVRLFSDGRVIYHGKQHVKKIGKYETRVDQVFIEKLMEEVQWKGFFNLEDQYPVNGNILYDFPSTFTFIAVEGQAKSIHNNYDSPLALRELEFFLEKQFDQLDWRLINSGDSTNY